MFTPAGGAQRRRHEIHLYFVFGILSHSRRQGTQTAWDCGMSSTYCDLLFVKCVCVWGGGGNVTTSCPVAVCFCNISHGRRGETSPHDKPGDETKPAFFCAFGKPVVSVSQSRSWLCSLNLTSRPKRGNYRSRFYQTRSGTLQERRIYCSTNKNNQRPNSAKALILCIKTRGLIDEASAVYY